MKIEFRNKKTKYPYIISDDKHQSAIPETLIINERQGKITLKLQDTKGNITTLPSQYCLHMLVEVSAGSHMDCTVVWNKKANEDYQLFLRVEKTDEIKIFSLKTAQDNTVILTTDPTQRSLGHIWQDTHDSKNIEELKNVANMIEALMKATKPEKQYYMRSTAVNDNSVPNFFSKHRDVAKKLQAQHPRKPKNSANLEETKITKNKPSIK